MRRAVPPPPPTPKHAPLAQYTLNEDQIREQEVIKRQQDLLSGLNTVTVQGPPVTLAPDEPKEYTVALPFDALHVAAGEDLPAAVESHGNAIQSMPLNAKALNTQADGRLSIQLTVGIPHRGEHLDDEVLFDKSSYGEQSVIVGAGGKAFRILADLAPPPEVRPNASYDLVDAVTGCKIGSATNACMGLSWEDGERSWGSPATRDGTAKPCRAPQSAREPTRRWSEIVAGSALHVSSRDQP